MRAPFPACIHSASVSRTLHLARANQGVASGSSRQSYLNALQNACRGIRAQSSYKQTLDTRSPDIVPFVDYYDEHATSNFAREIQEMVEDIWEIPDSGPSHAITQPRFTAIPSLRNTSSLKAAEAEWLQSDFLEPSEPEESSAELASTASPFNTKPPVSARGPVKERRASRDVSRPRMKKRLRPPPLTLKPGDPFYEEVKVYQTKFHKLLMVEQASEASQLKERMSRPLEKLCAEGYCITDLSAFWLDATQFGLPVAVFSLGPGQALPVHNFEIGSQVVVSQGDPLGEEKHLGSVVGKTATQLKLAFYSRHTFETGVWRLDLGSSDISYTRMKAAIEHLHFDPSNLAVPKTSSEEPVVLGTYLRKELLESLSTQTGESPTSKSSILMDDQRLHSWARRYQRSNPVVLDGDPDVNLNESQIMAVASMLANRLSLVQGPPGTGKSRTLVEAVKVLRHSFNRKEPILVSTYTNAAVDNLVEAFSKVGIEPLRVGFAGRVSSKLHQYTLDAKIEKHPLKADVDKLGREISKAERRVEACERALKMSKKDDNGVLAGKLKLATGQVGQLRGERWRKERQMLSEIISSADVICTTAVTSACAALQVIDFPIVFMDEASMSTEPAALIPIMRGSEHVALVGDHKQLPPVVTSPEALEGGLGVSLFERLADEGNTPLVMLSKQYRMHPQISRFPNTEFYDMRLLDGTVDADGGPIDSWSPPVSSLLPFDPVTGKQPSAIFLDHRGPERRMGRSLENLQEAEIICHIIEDLLLRNPTLSGDNIGIIAPYVAQIKLISRFLRSDTTRLTRFTKSLGEHRMHDLPRIEVKTVDGFEGREKDVIIFSTVRSNWAGHIGFLGDRRRLNVGLTRARRGLFVVGNSETLAKGNVSSIFGGGGWGNPNSSSEQMPRVTYESDGVWARFVRFMIDQNLMTKFQALPSPAPVLLN